VNAAPRPYARLSGPLGSPLTLYEGDGLTGLARTLVAGSVDVVVTSPPYNLGAAYANYDDARPRAEYLGWIGRFGERVDRALAPAGSFFLNLGSPPSRPGWAWEVAQAAGRPFVLQNVIHWVKSIAIDHGSAGARSGLDRDLALGHYKPVQSRRYLNSNHEYVFHFTRDGDVPLDRLAIGVPYQDPSNATRWRTGAAGLRCRGNTWFLPYPTIQRRARDRPHPASFPVELPERCLRLHGTARTHLVVDPFLGIGPSALAAARLGRPFVGFDVDPQYLGEARRRLIDAGAGPSPEPAGPVVAARRAGLARRPPPASD
jgi:site-specific DNA-methyltransferase (adenine-specific)